MNYNVNRQGARQSVNKDQNTHKYKEEKKHKWNRIQSTNTQYLDFFYKNVFETKTKMFFCAVTKL